MEQDKFITRLQELADITSARPPIGPKIRKPNGQELVFRNGQEIPIDPKDNQTWGVKVKKLKPIVKDCEDCGLTVENRVINRKLYTFPQTHWRTNCSNCRRTLNPETGQFDIDLEQCGPYFASYFLKQNK